MFIYFLLGTLSLFIIIIVWWFRWFWRRRKWRTWVWIRVSWYVRYQIGLIVVWLRNSFWCPGFCWWGMQWWQRVTCNTLTKHWWSVYRRMYRQLQYLFYCTNIWWIMDWSDVFLTVWNELIWVGVIWINVNWVGIFCLFRFIIEGAQFSTSKSFSRSAFWKLYCL